MEIKENLRIIVRKKNIFKKFKCTKPLILKQRTLLYLFKMISNVTTCESE